MGNGLLGASVLEALVSTGQLLEKKIYGELKSTYDMDMMHIKILLYLADNTSQEVKVSSLMGVAGCTQAYLTLLTDKLQNMGLLERKHSQADRRIVHVSLTSEGLELATKMQADHGVVFSKVFAALSAEKLEELLDFCTQIGQTLHEPQTEEAAA